MIQIDGMRTQGGTNSREHWRVRDRRVRAERSLVAWSLRNEIGPALPCVVTLTRCAPSNGLDDDNLASALKSVRDEVAKWLGVDDRHRDIVRYEYEQRRGPWSVCIAWRPMDAKEPE